MTTVKAKPLRLMELAPSIDVLIRDLTQAANVVLNEAEKDYRATYISFTNKPVFKKDKATLKGSMITGSITTSDENYARLNSGTKKHLIVARRKRYLKYQMGYHPKTKPGQLRSGSSSYTGAVKFRKVAHHPGITPRHFEDTVSLFAQNELDDQLNVILKRLAK